MTGPVTTVTTTLARSGRLGLIVADTGPARCDLVDSGSVCRGGAGMPTDAGASAPLQSGSGNISGVDATDGT
jgi:hypothetical protein